MTDLAGRKIIVTGAATGMGAATMAAFARAGADTVGLFRNRQPDDPHARYLRCDVADPASVEGAFDEAVALLGGLDVLVHCAAIDNTAPAETITLAQFDEMQAINVRGTFLTNQAAFRHLKDDGGKIINFASAAGVIGLPGQAHYAASKGAVLAWTRTIAREWARFGITVNAIAPAIWTPMYEEYRDSMNPEALAAHDQAMKYAIPMGGKLGDAERDFAPLMVFLAGPGANFLTGQTYKIDGGALMLS